MALTSDRAVAIRTLVAIALLCSLAGSVGAEPLRAGSSLESFRIRVELQRADGALYGWDDLELVRVDDDIRLRWALSRPTGEVHTQEVHAEIRDGFLLPIETRRIERDARGATVFELHATGLAAPEGEVEIRTVERGDARIDSLDVDDPPLYPSVISGAFLQAIVDREADATEFTLLVEYPWGHGTARVRASVLEDRAPTETLLGPVATRRIHLEALHSWILDLVIRMVGIDTSVYFDLAREHTGRPLVRFEGSVAYDSGRLYGRLVAHRMLPEGKRLDVWPPPIEGYTPDALLEVPGSARVEDPDRAEALDGLELP